MIAAASHVHSLEETSATSREIDQPATQYWLPRDIHACATDEGVIFLDVKRDKYFGVPLSSLTGLRALVPGWQWEDASADPSGASAATAMAAAQALECQGLLTRDASLGRSATPLSLPPVEMMPIGEDLIGYRPGVRAHHAMNFLRACVHTQISLRYRALEENVERARVRKARLQRSGARTSAHKALKLAAIYRQLRAYAYTGRDHCLFHALSLTTFLSYYGQGPMWVIGVKTDPFAAHSWVQLDGVVIEDNPEEVCLFTPIFAI